MLSVKGHMVAAYARDTALVSGNAAKKALLSNTMCYTAAVNCAYEAGGITLAIRNGINHYLRIDNYALYVDYADPTVDNETELRSIPQGSFIGFFDEFMKNVAKPRLIHAMVATGHGTAVGTKNSCIGIGEHSTWEALNLAKLRWMPGSGYFNAFPPGNGGMRRLKIRYRVMDKVIELYQTKLKEHAAAMDPIFFKAMGPPPTGR